MKTPLQHFIELMEHPLKFRIFLFSKLPSAFFAGVRLRKIDGVECVVTVPFKWFSQNPFRSTYFACLGMAAELSTGALAMAHCYKSDPSVSMLVTSVEGHFFKKAIATTTFVCVDGNLFREIIEEAIITREARSLKATSVGRNKAGEVVSEFVVTWSFKAKSSGKA